MVFAVSGKGGTGKSTLAALIVRYLVRRGQTPVLAVDADPNSTLGDKVGVSVDWTIGDLREDTLKHKYDAPTDAPKQRSVEYQVQQAVVEGRGFDFLAMGRGEGPGCYCSVNNMVRAFLHDVSSSYRHVVVDNEAGMEHLSRRTDDKVDCMLVIGDQTPPGLKAARRIAALARQLEILRGSMGLVVNRVVGPCAPEQAAEATGLEVMAVVPEDPLVREFELRGEPLLGMPDDSPAVAAVNEMLRRLGC